MVKKEELLKEMGYKEKESKDVKKEFEIKIDDMRFCKYKECKNE